MARLRRAGTPWRILVHRVVGGGRSDLAYDVASDKRTREDSDCYRHIELPGTEFDELVVGKWIHIEQMDTGKWWMSIGGVVIWVRADRDGRPTSVDVYGPNAYAEAVEGCEYYLIWDEDPEPKQRKETR